MTIITVRTVYLYVLKTDQSFFCFNNRMFYFRSELAIAYPDELTGEVPQAKKGWGYKNVSE